MGIALPQLAPASEDRSSGALAVDGSLRFNKASKLHLLRTPGSSGNQKTWTLSFWFKKQNMGDQRVLFNSFTDNSNRVIIRFMSDKLQFALQSGGTFYGLQTNQVFRDNGWYHVVMVLDTTQNNETSRQRIYVNGDKIADGDLANNSISGSNKYPTKDATFNTNTTVAHYIGANNESSAVQDTTFDGQISNAYLIDGLAIAPAFFGYTDPLTNVWRPRGKLKKTVNDGTNFTADITNTGSTLSNPGRIFDGTIDSDATIASGAATITYTPSTPIKYTDSVRVMGSGSPSGPYNARWQLNGGSNVSTVNANEFVTLDEGNGGGTITTIKLTVDSGGANWRAIQVDGVIMKASAVTSIEFGTNGYYLPFDGNSPIGEDQSGNGNDWTPVNFGGSATLDEATGAKPILNTINGGTVARAGVFGGDVSASYTTTSASNSGGKYYFSHDASAQPTFSFIRGATYVFDWSASSGHPLRFATAADAAGSTEYTDGTNVTGNVTKITVPHNAPDTLYYYCNVHNGMGNSISVTTDETKADPYAWKNVLALPLLGTDDDGRTDLSNPINCTSTEKAVTANGNAAASNAYSNFYGGSYYFDGNGDYLTLANSADFAYGTGDFTIESWIYPTNVTNYKNFYEGNTNGSTTASVRIQIKNTGVIEYLVNNVGRSTGAVVPASVWTHVALTRASNTVRLFVNGVNVDEYTNSGNLTSQSLQIGRTHDNYDYVGYIQDYRVYKGVAKYTSNFIAAATDPDILPDSPSGVATKSKLKKVTDGAVSFDGTGDEVNVPGHSDLAFGTGNFTIDCFAYFNSFDDTYPTVLSKLVDSTLSWIVRVKSNGKVVWYSKNGGGTNNESSAEPIVLKKWHHIAVVREGTGTDQLKVYVDGTAVLTMTDSNDYNDNSPLCIGTQQAGGGNTINGFISNVRIVKGTALYTGNFAPPGKKLANVTNTKLLCCQSNSSATAAAVIPTGSITAAGNAAATNFNPFNTDINTVRGQEGSYATLNPLANSKFQSKTLKDGNLELSGNMSGGSGYPTAFSNFTMNGSGKFYMEATPFNTTDTSGVYIGLCDDQMTSLGVTAANTYPGGPGGVAYAANGTISDNNSNTFTSQPTYTAGDVISVAYDADNGKVYFAKNGNYIAGANPVTGANPHDTGRTGDQFFVVGGYENRNVSVNFGQKPFKFPPPDGYQPLTSSTLKPDTIITRPDQYVKANIYQGNGSSRSINVGFRPDMIWLKDRTQATHNNNLIDSLNGAPNIIVPDSAATTLITNTTDGLTAITDTGFNLGANTAGTQSYELNKNGNNYVAWTWRAGGAPTASNDNTSGAMDANSVSLDGVLQSAYTPSGSPNKYPSKMSIGTKQGFSVVQFELGPSDTKNIPHGLSEVPTFYIIKNVDAGDNFVTYSTNIDGSLDYVFNYGTDGFSNSSRAFPTTSKVEFSSNSAGTHIMYCWHDVPGLHKSGTYKGNNSSNGPVIDLGFRPAIILLKKLTNTDSNSGWHWYDNKRNTYNPANNFLLAGHAYYENRAANNTADVSSYTVDFLSTGFRLSHGSNNLNNTGETYFYAAWAEAPAFNLYGAQSNAR